VQHLYDINHNESNFSYCTRDFIYINHFSDMCYIDLQFFKEKKVLLGESPGVTFMKSGSFLNS
jgi:hypothetical protein